MAIDWSRGGYDVSDDPSRLDIAAIHRFLSSQSYWAEGLSEALLARAIGHSLCFGLYRGAAQVGFAPFAVPRPRRARGSGSADAAVR
jgi:hypothetical protein